MLFTYYNKSNHFFSSWVGPETSPERKEWWIDYRCWASTCGDFFRKNSWCGFSTAPKPTCPGYCGKAWYSLFNAAKKTWMWWWVRYTNP